ncbi:MAG TPA: HTH domain-containing protein, partial [Myxococcaceae bacterium]|nr:HTH domain-containing protein [Myxococcaceae bacterium]
HMTFYEAALRVLEAAGQPLTSVEITERSIAQGLLSHVGKTPEQTMLSRLAAMARRTRDRRVTVTGPDTFALTDWGLAEDAAALESMSAPYEHPEEGLPPLRPVERHPEPRNENVRGIGRQERRRRAEEEERGKKRRYPPVPEVAFELLGEADVPLAPSEVLRLARERQLASDEFQPEALLTNLAEENQRRIDAGRRPNFALDPTGALMLERDDAPVAEVQSAFARALNLPFSEGRIDFRQASPSAPEAALADDGLVHDAKSAVKEARRATARALRAHLASLESGTLEKACVKMLHALHFREIKVAKRGNHGPLFTARRKDGSLELRWAIRIHRGNGPVDRRAVQDCRRDLQHQSAHTALLIATGDLRSDARSEALSGAPVNVWAGEGLAEKFLESHTGVRVVSLELFELDRAFFEDAARGAEESRRRREERHREREERAERAEPSEPAEPAEAAADDDEGAEEDGDEEGPEETGPEVAAAGAEGGPAVPGEPGAGERRRRRRRRRGRRGRGREGTPGPPGTDPAAAGNPPSGPSSGGQDSPGPAPEPPESAAPPSESPSGGGQSPATDQG